MRPEDVPADLVETAMEAYREWASGHPRWTVTHVLAAVLPEHERQVRAQVAEEILADVAALFAARVGADLWEAAYRSAKIARGEL